MNRAIGQHFDQRVDQIVSPRCQNIEHFREQDNLPVAIDERDQNDQPAMDVEPGRLLEEVTSVVRDDHIVIGKGERDEVPVFQLALPI